MPPVSTLPSSSSRPREKEVDFEASSEGSFLPRAPRGTRLARVTFRTCPGSRLALQLAADGSSSSSPPPLDEHGVANDSWWTVRCADLPDRTTRLTRGSHSLSNLLRRYGFQDASGCIHHHRATAHFCDAASACPSSSSSSSPSLPARVPSSLLGATGVPQFYPRSGVCWFASLCWTSFANPRVRSLVLSRMPSEVRSACERCLHSRDEAERFRKWLWYTLHVGDNVDDPPEWDGRNGFHEFSVMAARLGIPLLRFREKHGKLHPLDDRLLDRRDREVRIKPPRTLSEPHLLVLRFQDGKHGTKFPARRRVVFHGHRYALVGVYAGARKCGHQIGFASHTGHWRDWSIGDADLHKDGIGPIFIRFEGDKWKDDAWWDAWRTLVHVTKFGNGTREFCSLSWHNPRDDSLDGQRIYGSSSSSHGTVSQDFLYVSEW